MNWKLIEKACYFANEKHKGQLDDEGRPFMVHPIQVADFLMRTTADSNLISAAYLHDTLEDTDTTYEELLKEFGKDIADLVAEVTHEGTKKTGYYFPRLKTHRGIMLKFADRLSNISRMEGWDDKRREHYLRRSRFWKEQA